MFCTECGAQLVDGARFCTVCGTMQSGAVSGLAEDAPAVQPPTAPNAQANAAAPSVQPPVAPSVQPQAAAPAVQPPTAPNAQANAAAPSVQPPVAPSPQAQVAAPAPKRASKAPIIGIAAVVAVAAVIAAGVATNWFGLAGGGGGPAILLGAGGDANATYVVTARTNYDENGDVEYEGAYEIDEHGNVMTSTGKGYEDGKLSYTSKTTSKRDENGFVERRKTTTEYEDGSDPYNSTSRYDNKFDDEGQLVTAAFDETTIFYDYHDNGHLKTYSSHYAHSDGDYRSQSVDEDECDENGYPLRSTYAWKSTSSESSTTYTIDWEFDAQGKPSSYTISGKRVDDGKTNEDEDTCTVELDDAGNIVAIYDGDGTLRAELEYERIDDPSLYVKSMITKPMYVSVDLYD